ncbi:tRNA glutamyl-Q(34) synthetase GluQRS [Algiphilus sp. NNCM1]|uniref:tRNA glutamyl-Q(34) synthetase GluQRS n=1 Tax=Algiphilus sp. TaxID=1872431 RepID=UPI001CA747F9|nr:tRNA glutamyl-Q(34) synthetase GluQRS [Algiphilus sp.]MBY8966817.1 tRNA glutamyl-Q(34) synthetase GluQRS [Algiphilus acroporae]MCI5061440.1 tRNA glutamyl-Q(34) synthetase GluQRS [Algiphilus sp.]MCI5104012.1 tRNA glutamyl-Q(34) synthetase GluQRS [Algiphilus sp.]
MTSLSPYRGRFAPTPSGPLHMGSLLTAVLSWLDARAHNGAWLLRIDDLDTARCSPQHTQCILQQLRAHGLHWDGPVYYQSQALDHYADAVQQLCAQGHCFACTCTRKALRSAAASGAFGPVYPGTCRSRVISTATETTGAAAIRMRVPDGAVHVEDDWRGKQRYDWQHDIGDVVLRRRDGIYGYALACAVDEAQMAITHVVRGADLLAATPVHWHVLHCLGHLPPRSRHGPLVLRNDGAKLSKQNHARAIDPTQATANLKQCLGWLGIPQHLTRAGAAPEIVLQTAVEFWRQRNAALLLRADVTSEGAQ